MITIIEFNRARVNLLADYSRSTKTTGKDASISVTRIVCGPYIRWSYINSAVSALDEVGNSLV
jgi:hypothetical protein